MENLVVLNNEKISEKNKKFYCRNFNFKILPEGLNKFFNVQYIARKSRTNEHHELNLQNVKIASRQENIHYFGYLPSKQTIPLIRGSEILIQPSLIEGISTSILEAMAFKTVGVAV